MDMAHSRDPSFADEYYTSSPTREDAPLLDSAAYPVHYAQQQQQPQAVRQPTTLAQIHIPSFRSFASSIPVPSPRTQKRKPAPFHLSARSPRAASFSLAEKASPRLAEPASGPLSLDSPLPQQPNGLAGTVSPPPTEHGDRASYTAPNRAHTRNQSIDSRLAGIDSPSSYTESRRSSIPIHTKYAQERSMSHAPKQSVSSVDLSEYTSPEKGTGRTSMHIPQAPSMTLQYDGVKRTLSEDSLASEPTFAREQRPKSPGGRLGSFFGWKSSSQRSGTESPTTTFSDRSLSPLPSPRLLKPLPASSMDGSTSTARLTPPGLDINKANARTSIYFDNPDTPILLGSPDTNAHVRELERELAQVSTELAGSIRREMDLEDELDRIRAEMPTIPPAEMARRTSDYFSDSGTSSVRYPVSDPDARLEQMEQKLRKVEQEKAQIKIEVASTMQAELARRRDLEQMVRDLEENLYKRAQDDEERGQVEERMLELEANLDEAKRRLSQERQAKDSFGDLYSATKLELEQHRNERDNLRDEVLPQLRARVEGLESDGADTQALVYENTRLQQELAAMTEEMQKIQGTPRFSSIAEEGDASSPGSQWGTLSRSNSQARTRTARGGSVTRSGSVKERAEGGRHRSGSVSGSAHPVSTEGVKEIEDQRDALHKALKLLISRYEKQRRDHELAVKKLTSAKTQAEQVTPKRTAYHREVCFLKEEVTTLRKRTEDALEQKWEYEKGLSGVKMDLDRAEQETRGLKSLLLEHDVFASGRQPMPNAYEDAEHAADDVQLSVSAAQGQRDHARQVAEEYRHRAESAHPSDSHELMSCAHRMDALADELEQQMQANLDLRARLADAVVKGAQEQRDSTRQIEGMQQRLAGLEDSVLAAQQHSETVLGNHESEVRRMEEASSPSLQRLRISIPEPQKLSPGSPPPSLLARSAPRLMMSMTKKANNAVVSADTSLLEASRTQMLERKVRELEGLLREAEDDVQVVVQRVNRSQLEVMDLQTERDAALAQMRKLQGLFVEEKERAAGLLEGG